MLVKVTVGGATIYFGDPLAPVKPAPFYPYLASVANIQDSTGDQTGSTSFELILLANRFIGSILRCPVQVLRDDLTLAFEGLSSEIRYTDVITVRVEA
jgi:hypothetical protein